MLPENLLAWGKKRNCMRELTAYGNARKAVIGAENVYDFSLGNPSIPAPDCVNEAIAEIIKGDSVELHGYTTAAGLLSLREKIANHINSQFGTTMRADRLYVTCGAASGLAICLRAVLFPGDEVIALAPFFTEYRVFVEASQGVLKNVPLRAGDFQIDIAAVEAALNEKTKAIIINSPNNPTGVILSDESLRGLSDVLRRHEEKTGNPVYLICDEPYRELVFDDSEVPCLLNYYDDTFICYSFSKALSIPGERIGYIAVSDKMRDDEDVYAAVLGAGRALGYINPPSLFQRVIERVIGATSDMSAYKKNRDDLYNGLMELGFDCVEPQGAFYLFMKAPEDDANHFSEVAKKYELLLVPSDDFGVTGYVRIAYCVDNAMIHRSMPAFKKLAQEYGLCK